MTAARGSWWSTARSRWHCSRSSRRSPTIRFARSPACTTCTAWPWRDATALASRSSAASYPPCWLMARRTRRRSRTTSSSPSFARCSPPAVGWSSRCSSSALGLGVEARDQPGRGGTLADQLLDRLKALSQPGCDPRDVVLRVTVVVVGHHACDVIPAHGAIDSEDEQHAIAVIERIPDRREPEL